MNKNRIGELRREMGLNQRELSERLRVGQTTVSAWETGKSEPDYRSIREMAALFEVSTDYLLGYSDDQIRRGLSPEEYATKQARLSQQRQEAQLEREVEKHERMEEQGIEEDIEDYTREAELTEWEESGLPVQFETYQTMMLMENASKAQREAALEHVRIAVKYPMK